MNCLSAYFYIAKVILKGYLFIGSEMRQRGRFAGFSIYVSNTGAINSSTLCYKDGPLLPPLDFTTSCFQHGRYVIFYNERLNDITYPEGYEDYISYTELCEVIVLGNILHYCLSKTCLFYNVLLCPLIFK